MNQHKQFPPNAPNEPLMHNDSEQPTPTNAYALQYQPQAQNFNQFPPQTTPNMIPQNPQNNIIRMPVGRNMNPTAQYFSNGQMNNLPEEPVFLSCSGCNTNGKTMVKRQFNKCLNILLIVSVFLILAGGIGLIFMICVLPCWWQSRMWVHSCERCGRALGRGRPISPICTTSDW